MNTRKISIAFILIALFILLSNITTASQTLTHSQTSGGSDGNIYQDNTRRHTSTYTPATNELLTNITLSIKRVGTAAGGRLIQAQIWTTNASGLPVQNIYNSTNTVDHATLGTSYELHNFSFTEETLTGGTQYAILAWAIGDPLGGATYGDVEYTTTGTETVGKLNLDMSWVVVDSTAEFKNYIYIKPAPVTGNLTITATNQINGSTITNFNVSIGATKYTTTNGTVYTNIPVNASATYNFNISSQNYITRQYVSVPAEDTSAQLYMSQLFITAKEVNTNLALQNFTIWYYGTNHTTTEYNITINATYGNANLSFYSPKYFPAYQMYYGVTGPSHTPIITGAFGRAIYFYNNLTGTTVEPLCSYDAYLYSTPIHTHISNSTMTCQLNGYNIKTITSTTNYPQNLTTDLYPVSLFIQFTDTVEGYLQTITNTTFLNVSSLSFPQANVSIGYVSLTFNKDGNNDIQQVFKYYNDGNTTISEKILVIDGDLRQPIKVTGNSQDLEDARVCVLRSYNDSYWTTHCDYTDSSGDVEFYLNDGFEYKFCATKTGYLQDCILQYIGPSNPTTYSIDLQSTTNAIGTNFVYTNCPIYYTENTSCTMEIITYKPYYEICLNQTYTFNNTQSVYEQCEQNTMSVEFDYDITSNYTLHNMGVYLTGTLTYTVYHEYQGNIHNTSVDGDTLSKDGVSWYQTLINDEILLVGFHIFVLIIGVISGYVIEKYFKGYGTYGAGLWFLFMGMMKLYVFYIPASMILIYFLIERFAPLFKD